jgi:hypothetical protein
LDLAVDRYLLALPVVQLPHLALLELEHHLPQWVVGLV